MPLCPLDIAPVVMAQGQKVESVIREVGNKIYYPKSMGDYAVEFGVAERTVKYWVGKGKKRDPRDLPPLHDASQMVLWWGRNCKQECPEGIRRAALRSESALPDAPELPLSETEEGGNVAPDLAARLIDTVDLSQVEAGGASESYDRCARVEASAYNNYQKEMAKDEPNLERVDYWYAQYQKASAQRRQWDNNLPKIMRELGELLPKAELTAEFVTLAGGLAQYVTRGFQAAVDELVPDRPKEERKALALQYRDACFSDLRESHFGLILKNTALPS